jgi:CTP:molybdopterin cytidylyltransferase MocA
MKVAAVVLAAGASRRLGVLKQLVRLDGETLVERALHVCREAECDPVVVVLGASADVVRKECSFDDDMDGCIVMTCDMPAVTAQHLRELVREGEVTASSYAKRRGVPAYFPRAMFAQLRKLTGDAGARDLLKQAQAVELEGGELDIDTAADLRRARELFSHPPA